MHRNSINFATALAGAALLAACGSGGSDPAAGSSGDAAAGKSVAAAQEKCFGVALK